MLIDELELALHPRAQANLLKYLEVIASQKHLTVIFSTHSVTLLKRARRSQILFLEPDGDGLVKTVSGCYPTYALGNIAYEEERTPNIVIYVEDEAALHVSEALLKLVIRDRYANNPELSPNVQIVPVGAFMSVIRFLARSGAMLAHSTKSAALLDVDVKDETVADWNATGNHAMLAELQAIAQPIEYLPWTPEVGLVDYLRDGNSGAIATVRQSFGHNQIQIRPVDIGAIPLQSGGPQRTACKAAVRRVAVHIRTYVANDSIEEIERKLFQIFGKWYFDANRGNVMGIFGRLGV